MRKKSEYRKPPPGHDGRPRGVYSSTLRFAALGCGAGAVSTRGASPGAAAPRNLEAQWNKHVIIAVPKETAPFERRVALVADGVKALVDAGHEVRVEQGAGVLAGVSDAAYREAGAQVGEGVVSGAALVLKVRAPAQEELAAFEAGAALIALLRPLDEPELATALAARGIDAFALELAPRITKAQSMDVLSSQATLAGYRAVLLAAYHSPKMFPMLVTAAGTISPVRVFVIGAGVAGLQAIATAKRLGAVVDAYDTRAAAAEQVESVGGRFISFDLETGDAEDAGGYARAQDEAFYERQRRLSGEHAAGADVLITTALVPGRRAPLLIDEAGIRGMKPGSVVIDLAAAGGGNCALTRPDEAVNVDGVLLLGPTNPASDLAEDASRMFSRNITALVRHLVDDKAALAFDLEDEITAGTLVTHQGKIRHDAVLEKLKE